MSNLQQWWNHLDDAKTGLPVDGLVQVSGYKNKDRPPEEVIMMEKARDYGATAVFFEAARNEKPSVAQAFIYIADSPEDDPAFAETHQKLWSWGGVPLVYRKLPGCVQLFRCTHGPDFVSKTGEPRCNPVKTLRLASAVSSDPWWDVEQLRNGTLWDNTEACNTLLSAEKSAHRGLIKAVKQLSDVLTAEGILLKPLRRKLLILSLLIAYLEQREVFKDGYLGRFLPGANEFFEVLANGEALVNLLEALEKRFNGNIFSLSEADRERLRSSGKPLARFSKLIEGREVAGGQLSLWKLYSFKDLPIELISHIYELFVKDADSSVYTPPFLVRLMLEESLSWERIDRLRQRGEIILDPSCGSGIFLVEAYKRLVLHWRSQNQWEKPSIDVLKGLLQQVHGIDLEAGAVELAAFSLCLALCDALEPEAIRKSIKLFPPLAGKTLHHSCFFEAKEQGLIKRSVGVVVGNPPFVSKLSTPGAERSYDRYKATYGSLPDKQLAYLFLHESMEMVADGGVLSMLQQYNFLYNQQSLEFRRSFIAKWDVREVLDFISVRGLFRADTKAIVVVAEASTPPIDRKILHATFRRSGRVDAELGFDIDYYDLHWLPRDLVLTDDAVWRIDLLGGGRVLGFVNQMKQMRTSEEYAQEQDWDFGEGFIEGQKGKLQPAVHITNKDYLPSVALTEKGIDASQITINTARFFKTSYTCRRFTPPMLLVRELEDMPHAIWSKSYLTYREKIVGFTAPKKQRQQLGKVAQWLTNESVTLRAFVSCISISLFTQKATTISNSDIFAIPYPESGNLDLSPNERILAEDIVRYYREFVRLGEDSVAMKESGHASLPDFTSVFSNQINAVYKINPMRPLEPQSWSGVICQPFVFGKGEVDWTGADELKDKLSKLLYEQQGDSLQITRICRIYDGNFVFLLKPDRLRYWLRSVALRDADEMLSDLRAQGY